MTDQEYKEALDWLFIQLPNYQIEGKKAYKPGLENITALCEFFGNPQLKLNMVHVGGTNGKGSTCHMLSSILQEAGYKVGLYTSPHLLSFTERLKVNGENADQEFVFQFIERLKKLPPEIKPSFFEFTTVMAFEYFYQKEVDIAIIEVGLGGRLDSTNIITPLVSAITNVDLDHQNILGNTLEEIAAEKAGIIKPNIPIICGDHKRTVQQIMKETALKNNAPYTDATLAEASFTTDLQGNYQEKNKKVVIALVKELRSLHYSISEQNTAEGFLNVEKNTAFMGRWTVISEDPLTICDTAHNLAGMQEVVAQLEKVEKQKHMVLGFVQDKELATLLELLPKGYQYYFVKPAIERGRNPEEYEAQLKNYKINYNIFQNVTDGYLAAIQSLKKDEMIFIGGSNFVVAEILKKVLEK